MDGSPRDGASDPEDARLQLYLMAVEMADRVSARRGLANTFFLSVNTGLAALLGGSDLRWYVAVAGLAFAVAWWWLLQSYRKLNAAKFAVINQMEADLPVQIFTDEWREISARKHPPALWPPRRLWAWVDGYHDLGTVERFVPIVFAAIYIAELIRQAAG